MCGLSLVCLLQLLLLLLNQLGLYQALDLGWTILSDISDAFASRANEPFESEIIAGRQWIMLIGFDVTPSILSRAIIELILVQHDLELIEVDRDRVLANDDTWVVLNALYLLEPGVTTNICRFETLSRVSIQDIRDQISTVSADEFRNAVIGVEDFLIENVRFRVFKR